MIICRLANSFYKLGQNLNLARISLSATDKTVKHIFLLIVNILPTSKFVATFFYEIPKGSDESPSDFFKHKHHVNITGPAWQYRAFGKYGPASTPTYYYERI